MELLHIWGLCTSLQRVCSLLVRHKFLTSVTHHTSTLSTLTFEMTFTGAVVVQSCSFCVAFTTDTTAKCCLTQDWHCVHRFRYLHQQRHFLHRSTKIVISEDIPLSSLSPFTDKDSWVIMGVSGKTEESLLAGLCISSMAGVGGQEGLSGARNSGPNDSLGVGLKVAGGGLGSFVVQVQRAHARVTGYVKRKWTEKSRHKMAEVPTQLRQIREDKTLIGLVKKYRLIYDPRHGDYKDVELKEEAWQNIADKLSKERSRATCTFIKECIQGRNDNELSPSQVLVRTPRQRQATETEKMFTTATHCHPFAASDIFAKHCVVKWSGPGTVVKFDSDIDGDRIVYGGLVLAGEFGIELAELVSTPKISIVISIIHLTKTRWRNLRERFVREKKRLVTLGEEAYSAKDPWPLLEDMTFLWDFIVHRKYFNVNVSVVMVDVLFAIDRRPSKTFKAKQVIMQSFLPILPRPEWVDVASDQGASSDNIEPSCTLKRGEETRLPIKRERDLVEEEAPESKLRRLLDQPSSPNDTNSDITDQIVGADAIERFDRARPSTDEDDLFCLSVAATLRRFNSSKKALAKLKIQQIMYELECSETSTSPKNRGNMPTETIFFS
uniref:BESS domain-containing protein n=1 Tax=Timema shepardi TaxID=629360 RepID=A0A7R9AW91_TIMSH|nr:unnamed protein product [Timema shepardi]